MEIILNWGCFVIVVRLAPFLYKAYKENGMIPHSKNNFKLNRGISADIPRNDT